MLYSIGLLKIPGRNNSLMKAKAEKRKKIRWDIDGVLEPFTWPLL